MKPIAVLQWDMPHNRTHAAEAELCGDPAYWRVNIPVPGSGGFSPGARVSWTLADGDRRTIEDSARLCREQRFGFLACLDPMPPGRPNGAGYHQRDWSGSDIVLPELEPETNRSFCRGFIEWFGNEYEDVPLLVQVGNEIEYHPLLGPSDERQLEHFANYVQVLAAVEPEIPPELPLITGGNQGLERVNNRLRFNYWFLANRRWEALPARREIVMDLHGNSLDDVELFASFDNLMSLIGRTSPHAVFVGVFEDGEISRARAEGLRERGAVAHGGFGRWSIPEWGVRPPRARTDQLGMYFEGRRNQKTADRHLAAFEAFGTLHTPLDRLRVDSWSARRLLKGGQSVLRKARIKPRKNWQIRRLLKGQANQIADYQESSGSAGELESSGPPKVDTGKALKDLLANTRAARRLLRRGQQILEDAGVPGPLRNDEIRRLLRGQVRKIEKARAARS